MVDSGSTWTLSLDIHGNNTIANKTATLAVGDNTYYVLVTAQNGATQLYTLKIRRKPTYDVVFDVAGGTSVPAQQVEEGDFVVAPQTTKTGYDFSAWNYDFSKPVTQNLTIVASWTAKQYTITYNANGGNVANDKTTVTYNSSYTLEVPARKGYEFLGWYLDAEKVENGTWQIASDVTLIAKWDIVTYTVNYHLNGGTNDASAVSQFTVESGSISLPTPTKIGYTFGGWFTDAQFNNSITQIAQGSHADVDVYAKWTPKQYYVTYDPNGGELSYWTSTVTYGEIPTWQIPTRTGYEFVGWYNGEEKIADGPWTITTNVHLTANWKANTYTITFNANGGEGTTSNQEFTYDTTNNLAENVFTRTGYSFVGWNTEADGSGISYDNAQPIVNLSTENNATVVLYAQWTQIWHSVKLDNQDGTTPTEVIVVYGDPMTPAPAPSREGYRFEGYFDDQGVKYYDSSMNSVRNWDRRDNGILYARWIQIWYNVSFDNQDGSTPTDSYMVALGEPMPTMSVPIRTGYRFDGYFDEEGVQYYDSSMNSVRNWDKTDETVVYVLYAHWTQIWHSVKLDNQDGTTPTEVIVVYGDPMTPAPAPSREGYRFEGYFDDQGVKYYDSSMNSVKNWDRRDNGILYARWTQIWYNVSFDNQDGSAPVGGYMIALGEPMPTMSVPIRTGYRFDGYFDEEGVQYYDSSMNSVKNWDKTDETVVYVLYAHWTQIWYTVDFDNQNGTFVNEVIVVYGEQMTELTDIPTLEGYKFIGYFDDSTGGVQYYNEDLSSSRTWDKTENSTLYAHWEAIAYNVVFDANTGSGTMSNQQIVYDTFATLNANEFTKTGYAFANWNTKVDGTGTKFDNNDSVKNLLSADGASITLYAQWVVVDYTITYQLDGGTNNSSNVDTFTIESEDISLLAPTKVGYTFGGWFTDAQFNNGITQIAAGSHENVDVYAKWDVVTYTITYHLNDGNNNINAVENFTVETETFAILSPSREGYTFEGWHTDASFVNAITQIEKGTHDDIVLYAKWTANNYTVTLDGLPASYTVDFNLNGATGTAPSTQVVTQTKGLEYPTNPTRDGYVFAGWYLDHDCTQKYDFTGVLSSDLTLYAGWTACTIKNDSSYPWTLSSGVLTSTNKAHSSSSTYKITAPVALTVTFSYKVSSESNYDFLTISKNGSNLKKISGSTNYVTYSVDLDANDYLAFTYSKDGSQISGSDCAYVSNVSYTSRVSCTSSVIGSICDNKNVIIIFDSNFVLPASTKTGYTFCGWYDGANGTGTQYTDALGNSVRTWDKMEDATLYAKWMVNTYTVTYHLNGGTNNESAVDEFTIESDNISLLEPTRVGYSFGGWFTDATFNNSITDISNGSHSNIDVYAKWNVITYTVNYYLDGGINNASNADTFTIESEDISLLAPTKVGHTFCGWFTDAQFNNSITQIAAGSHENVDVYAKWNVVAYTITFESNGGSSVSSITQDFGTAVTAPTNPSWVDHSFVGWYLDEDCTQAYTFDTMPANDFTLYAKWIEYEIFISHADITAISVNDQLLSATTYNATAVDTDGNSVDVVVTKLGGEQTAGKTVTIRLTATGLYGLSRTKNISAIKVYDTPTLTANTDKDYINLTDTLNASLFGATATDSFGQNVAVQVTTQQTTYNAADIVTIVISATDPVGNVATVQISNVKVYGSPVLARDTTVTSIKQTDEITNQLFGVTAVDSFGETLSVTTSISKGTQLGGSTITITSTAVDSKGNSNSIDYSIKVYSTPTFSSATKTDFTVHDEITIIGKVGKETIAQMRTAN